VRESISKLELNLSTIYLIRLRESLSKQNPEYLSAEGGFKTVQNQKEALVMYFTAHNEIKDMDFDGAGINLKSRKFRLIEDELWTQAVQCKDKVHEANRYINYLAYTQVPLMGDLRSEWDIRFHGNFKLLTNIIIEKLLS
jgi:hypothetical protein